MKQAVIYVRVSDPKQMENLSLGTQEKICREYCERNGIPVDRVFIEKGESAKTADRTEFQAMLEYCRENKNRLGFVVVYTVNRFARNNEDHFAVAGFLRRLGINLRSATEPIDETPAGKFVESMLAAVAMLDNEMRRLNTINGMKAALRIGRWPFKSPLGYSDAKDEHDKPLKVLDPERAPLVKKAFELFAAGLYTKKEVLAKVTDMGLRRPSGNKVAYRAFEWMLINPFYVGWVGVDAWGEPQTGNHQPLISQELFDQVQAISAGRRPAITSYQRNNPEFPLRQFAKCGVCGRPVTGSASTGRNGLRYGYYVCNRYCHGVCMRKEQMESAFLELVQRLQPRPEIACLFREIVLDVWKNKQGERVVLAAAHRRQLALLEERKQRLLDVYLNDKVLGRDTFKDQLDKLEVELATARLALSDGKDDALDLENVLSFAERVLTEPGQLWTTMSLDQRQRFQRVLFPAGIVLNSDKTIGNTGTCAVFNLLQPVGTVENSLVAQIAASWKQVVDWLREIEKLMSIQPVPA